jgi:hypothetical protein
MEITWTMVEEPEPVEEIVCPTGAANHTWSLSIEEGQMTLSPNEPCVDREPTMQFHPCYWWEMQDVYSDKLADVTIELASDCPGSGWYEHGSHTVSHPNRCDCNRWINLVPVEKESS